MFFPEVTSDLCVDRFLLGAMNGLVATSKTMISEVCTKTHEVVGMGAITGDESQHPESHTSTKLEYLGRALEETILL